MGGGQNGGKGDGEDGVALHPVADTVEDARGDALLEEGDAAGLADLIAEVSAGRGAKGVRSGRGRNQLLWRAARTTIMMSVMPGTGRWTKEESTTETRKSPKRPKPKRKCNRGEV